MKNILVGLVLLVLSACSTTKLCEGCLVLTPEQQYILVENMQAVAQEAYELGATEAAQEVANDNKLCRINIGNRFK